MLVILVSMTVFNAISVFVGFGYTQEMINKIKDFSV